MVEEVATQLGEAGEHEPVVEGEEQQTVQVREEMPLAGAGVG